MSSCLPIVMCRQRSGAELATPCDVIVLRDEFHALVDALVPFTRFMLEQHHGFLPLGAIVKGGEIAITDVSQHQSDMSTQEWLQHLRDALRVQAVDADCVAVAYCADVKLTDTRDGGVIDAVQVVFEHRSGEALEAFFPYKKTDDAYEFAQPMVRMGAQSLFETPASCPVH
jgi:hypothetical protein